MTRLKYISLALIFCAFGCGSANDSAQSSPATNGSPSSAGDTDSSIENADDLTKAAEPAVDFSNTKEKIIKCDDVTEYDGSNTATDPGLRFFIDQKLKSVFLARFRAGKVVEGSTRMIYTTGSGGYFCGSPMGNGDIDIPEFSFEGGLDKFNFRVKGEISFEVGSGMVPGIRKTVVSSSGKFNYHAGNVSNGFSCVSRDLSPGRSLSLGIQQCHVVDKAYAPEAYKNPTPILKFSGILKDSSGQELWLSLDMARQECSAQGMRLPKIQEMVSWAVLHGAVGLCQMGSEGCRKISYAYPEFYYDSHGYDRSPYAYKSHDQGFWAGSWGKDFSGVSRPVYLRDTDGGLGLAANREDRKKAVCIID